MHFWICKAVLSIKRLSLHAPAVILFNCKINRLKCQTACFVMRFQLLSLPCAAENHVIVIFIVTKLGTTQIKMKKKTEIIREEWVKLFDWKNTHIS